MLNFLDRKILRAKCLKDFAQSLHLIHFEEGDKEVSYMFEKGGYYLLRNFSVSYLLDSEVNVTAYDHNDKAIVVDCPLNMIGVSGFIQAPIGPLNNKLIEPLEYEHLVPPFTLFNFKLNRELLANETIDFCFFGMQLKDDLL